MTHIDSEIDIDFIDDFDEIELDDADDWHHHFSPEVLRLWHCKITMFFFFERLKKVRHILDYMEI